PIDPQSAPSGSPKAPEPGPSIAPPAKPGAIPEPDTSCATYSGQITRYLQPEWCALTPASAAARVPPEHKRGTTAMKVGMFAMPMHDPVRPYLQTLREDQEAVRLADRLGYSEFWVGEHFTSKAEQITSPLIFLATMIAETKQIKFGTGVINLPQAHPAVVAGYVALFDQLAEGRFLFGIGPGGLHCDFELFKLTDHAQRPRMMYEGIDMILKMWASDPPYRLSGEFWDVKVEETVERHFGRGDMAKPYQQPHPPIALPVVSPNSPTAAEAGRRGWIAISGSALHERHLPGHWESYAAGSEAAGRRPDPANWRVTRSVLVTESDAEAEDYLALPGTGMAFYMDYFLTLPKARQLLKSRDDMPDSAQTLARAAKDMCIHGSPKRVREKLMAIREASAPFGTLLCLGHDWDRPAMWRRSIELMATQVAPRIP
ncbi:MAG: LLM class flavin-dependent oxidoreductase, partial [Alphaproteobacteria bacterium]|nr:LLM class flavin-dependent oxidoreductase [Alphaproteobacteria bacterium]